MRAAGSARPPALIKKAVATLILSGAFIGFLPDHYAAAFVRSRYMRALAPERLGYDCVFSAITRRSPAPSRCLHRRSARGAAACAAGVRGSDAAAA